MVGSTSCNITVITVSLNSQKRLFQTIRSSKHNRDVVDTSDKLSETFKGRFHVVRHFSLLTEPELSAVLILLPEQGLQMFQL